MFLKELAPDSCFVVVLIKNQKCMQSVDQAFCVGLGSVELPGQQFCCCRFFDVCIYSAHKPVFFCLFFWRGVFGLTVLMRLTACL